MLQSRKRTPEQFIAQSPVGESLKGVFECNLAAGALRLVVLNGELQKRKKPGNNEVKVGEVLKSGCYGIVNQNPEFVEAEIDSWLIKDEDVPEAYFELQQRIARERGYGVIEITDELRQEAIKTLRGDQAESLSIWTAYLRGDENGHDYPDWFKVYVWESLKKMGEFDKEKGEFKKRTKSTVAPWPELSAEALAYVWDGINEGVIKGNGIDDEDLARLLDSGNFSKLYAHAVNNMEAGGNTPELREITEGQWVKYGQIQGEHDPHYQTENGEYIDNETINNGTVMSLVRSLQGKNTGWCTAGSRTAAHQLSQGDFYVYYTQDEKGNDTIPRIAIRMEGGMVAEVRGIEPDQNLEASLTDVVADKLKTLPGGDRYFEKVENMKRVTEIYERVKAGGELTAGDITFLRFSGKIEGFGWGRDPRVGELVGGMQEEGAIDRVLLLGTQEDVDDLVSRLQPYRIANCLDKLFAAGANIDVDNLVSRLEPWQIAYCLDNLLGAGANIDDLVSRLGSLYTADCCDKLLNTGYRPNKIVTRLKLLLYRSLSKGTPRRRARIPSQD